MQANHREAQAPEDTLSLILMMKQECTNRRDEERMVVVLASTSCLGLLRAGSFGVVHVLWEISSVYA